MSEVALGQATIVYDHPDDGVTEETLDNEQVMYIRDHWTIKAGTDDDGNDLMYQIPRDRVHYVARNVERFEEEVSTVRHRIESIASDIREKLPGTDTDQTADVEVTTIPIESDEE